MSEQNRPPHISRRTLLRGLGVAMALPWLESLSFAADSPVKTAVAPIAKPPPRLIIAFSGDGFNSREWWAKGEGANMELGKVLDPLQPWREKMIFINGLYNEQALKGNIHSSQTGNLFSGAPLLAHGQVRSGVSFAQIIAQRIGDRTRLPSLVLGCEESMPGIHGGYSMIYSSHISWSTPGSPTAMETRPSLAFDQLFSTEAPVGQRSVIDAVLGHARQVQDRLSMNDRHRFNEYLDSVRELEARITRSTAKNQPRDWKPILDKPDMPRPKDGIPNQLPEYLRQMCDIIVLAFKTDTTRVASLKLCNDMSMNRYPHIGVDDKVHHIASHGDGGDFLRINQFYTGQIAYLAKQLDAIREGSGTMLDNTIILYCSSMMAGSTHNSGKLPMIVVGGNALGLKGGRIINRSGKPDRAMCSLYLSLMDKFGVRLDKFGDSDQRLVEIG